MRGLRIGLVCPYSLDRPGGVQNHVLGLAEALRGLGHHPAVLAPGDLPALDPELDFTSAGPSLPVPYNGSIARVSFGPVTAGRVRRWLRDGGFDLVHLHEPITPSISLQALRFAEVPVVATYHTATPRSRTMQVAGDALRRLVEKVDAGIAVSEPARDVVVRHLGRDRWSSRTGSTTRPSWPPRPRPRPRPDQRRAGGEVGTARGSPSSVVSTSPARGCRYCSPHCRPSGPRSARSRCAWRATEPHPPGPRR